MDIDRSEDELLADSTETAETGESNSPKTPTEPTHCNRTVSPAESI